MGAFSNFTQAKILNWLLGGAAYTPPATQYLALFTTQPASGPGTGGVEVTGGSYARLAIAQNQTNWPSATGGSPETISNGVQLSFAQATADWSSKAPVVGWGLFDAPSGGNLIASGTLSEGKIVYGGDTFYFPAGNLAVQQN